MLGRLLRRRTRKRTEVFGIMAEFAGADELLDAVKRAKQVGYEEMEAYTPMPLHEVAELLGYKSRLPALVFGGGALGAATGFGLQYWASVHSYPINIGGRPYNSWPSFIVITFELTILFAALTAVLGMLALNGLPRPHHPAFSVPIFELASRNRFFLLVLGHDPKFDRAETRRFLEELPSLGVEEVPNP